MAYDKEDIINQCIEVITREECTEIVEIISHLPISRPTFYLWELDKLDTIKDAIEQTKVNLKTKLKKNWRRDDASPVLQIAAFKLMANDSELEKITISKVNAKVENIQPIIQEADTHPKDEPITS
jgi:ACT domain-containing protein